MIPKGHFLEEHYHYRQMVSQCGTSSSPVLQKATFHLGTDARVGSDFLLLLKMQGLFPLLQCFQTNYEPHALCSSLFSSTEQGQQLSRTQTLQMMLLKKKSKGTWEERQGACMHAQRKAGSGEQSKILEEQAAGTDGSVSLSTVSLRKRTHLQLSWETLHFTAFGPIYHMPRPWQILYFRTTSIFSHPMDLLCRLLSEEHSVAFVSFYYKSVGPANAILRTQSCQTGEATSYQAPSEGTFVCTANHICLASGDLKANIASLFIISSPTRSSFTSGPKLPGSAGFWSWHCPREDVWVLQLSLQTRLWVISSSPAPLGHFSKLNLHTVGLNSKSKKPCEARPYKQKRLLAKL